MGYSKALQEKLDELTKLQRQNRELLQAIKDSIHSRSSLEIITEEQSVFSLNAPKVYKAITSTGDDFEKSF